MPRWRRSPTGSRIRWPPKQLKLETDAGGNSPSTTSSVRISRAEVDRLLPHQLHQLGTADAMPGVWRHVLSAVGVDG